MIGEVAAAPPAWYADKGTNIHPCVGSLAYRSSYIPAREIERSRHRGSEYCCSSYPIPERLPPSKK